MKTQQELMQAYWGPGGTVDIVRAYNDKHGSDVKPWECVRTPTVGYENHPGFVLKEDGEYTFFLTILYDDKRKEHRPVFVGDKLYYKEDGSLITMGNGGIITNPDNWSWNPPTPKRTFKLNDLELPCPERRDEGGFLTTICGNSFLFDTYQDCDEFKTKLMTLLTAARDKE